MNETEELIRYQDTAVGNETRGAPVSRSRVLPRGGRGGGVDESVRVSIQPATAHSRGSHANVSSHCRTLEPSFEFSCLFLILPLSHLSTCLVSRHRSSRAYARACATRR